MKTVLTLFFLILGMGFTSCINEEDDQLTLIEVSESTTFDSQENTMARIGIRLKFGTLHRRNEVLPNGKVCNCLFCFGLCDFSFSDNGGTLLNIIKQDDRTYIYLAEAVDHAEAIFFVDEDLEIVVTEYGEEVNRILKTGAYNFEYPDEYEDMDSANPTFGRVEVIVE